MVLTFDALTFAVEQGANGYRWGPDVDATGDILNIALEPSETPLTAILSSGATSAMSDTCEFKSSCAINIADAVVTLDGTPLSFDDCGLSKDETFEVFVVPETHRSFDAETMVLGQTSWNLEFNLNDDPDKACTPESCAARGTYCDDSGRCVACINDGHCTDPALSSCSPAGICVPDTSANCSTSCSGDLICTPDGRCVECTEVAHCGHDDLFECINNECKPQPCKDKPPEFACVDVNDSGSCPTKNTITGLCPGGANIQCCSPEVKARTNQAMCVDRGGRCLSTDAYNCSAPGFETGNCPESGASIKCCTTTVTNKPSGGGGGTTVKAGDRCTPYGATTASGCQSPAVRKCVLSVSASGSVSFVWSICRSP